MNEELSIKERTFENGNVVLFKRSNSSIWQARIRRYAGTWEDSSTKERDFKKAKQVATEKYKHMAWLQENNEIDVTRKFSDVAKLTVKQLQAELDAGTGKTVYKHYISAIENYLIPAFKNTLIHKIDHIKIVELEKFRTDKLGREANRSTVSTHNAALNRVFKTAVNKNFMLPIQVPELRNKGVKPKSRPYFSDTDYKRVSSNLRHWINKGHQKKTREIRTLLRDYVLILVNTGIRTGEEALNLRWKNITMDYIDSLSRNSSKKTKYLQLSVSGKTGTRTIVPRNAFENVITPLRRIQSSFPDLANLSDKELFKRNEYVFRMPDGKRIKHERLARNFHLFLKHYDLLTDAEGQQRSLYSLRHTYATVQIREGIDMATLAVQMGTSIAMLERHYSKLKPLMKYAQLSGIEKKEKKMQKAVESDEIKMLKELIEQQRKQLEQQQVLIDKINALSK